MPTPLAVVHEYFALVDAFETDATAYAAVLHPEVVQTEYPNALYKSLQTRSLTDILDNLRLGRELLQQPHFEVSHTRLCADGSVHVEGQWEATAASDLGPLLRGQRIRAFLCLIFEFKDGLIFRQRRYPCYEIL
ncbi:nuclear transport factor 2 family protein [Hymenobacter rigui]|uniref:Nuclear transport factor 2 family protein n=1 Tax=Hymenobacter rigui TaxID=334424 RepID=A0A3R9ME53_9BACT|nr:nuclear transport factor 2 family protein [Hymenobacter rigui]RSK43752.1 nuclear transport factor 2 family protein [Hymenobacter rigui]